jgi:hypothetical protein
MSKRHILVLFIAILFFFIIQTSFSTEIHFYKSNDIGMKLEEILEERMNEFSYILKVESSGEMELRSLFSGEKEVKRWELAFYSNMNIKEERAFVEDLMDNVKYYDRKGRPVEEQVYSDGSLLYKTFYYYSEKQAVSRSETFDSEGALLYREEYELSTKGILRRIKRTWNDGKVHISSFIYSKGKLITEFFKTGDELTISWYNEMGKLERLEVWRDDTLIRKKSLMYSREEGTLTETQEEDLLSGLSYTISFNKEGQMSRQVVKKADNVVEEYNYAYDNEGRQSKTERKSDDGLEEWIFSYNTKSELIKEEYYKKGVIEKQTIYTDASSYVEELFRKGELVIRVHYDDGEKVKEEFLNGGKVIRERTYIEEE